MDPDTITKELKKYDSMREKVLRLNELGKYNCIIYGLDYLAIDVPICRINLVGPVNINFESCIICKKAYIDEYMVIYINFITSNIKNCKNRNKIQYYVCNSCKNKNYKLCTTCLRESPNCATLTKQKITFWLCVSTIPKDIRRIIINLFFSIFLFQKN
jgi:hypothetical protein